MLMEITFKALSLLSLLTKALVLLGPEGPLLKIWKLVGAFPAESWLKGKQEISGQSHTGQRHVFGLQILPFKIVLDADGGCSLSYLGGGSVAVVICKNSFVCMYKMNTVIIASYTSIKVFLRVKSFMVSVGMTSHFHWYPERYHFGGRLLSGSKEHLRGRATLKGSPTVAASQEGLSSPRSHSSPVP